jgi:hypothetical protein
MSNINFTDKDDKHKQLSEVVSKTNYLESKINNIILKYLDLKPEREHFADWILFNNSILNLSAKIKLLCYISNAVGYEINAHGFHNLLQIRNAFAHTDFNSDLYLEIGENGEIIGSFSSIKSIKSDGKLDIKNRNEAYQDFSILFDEMLCHLSSIEQNINILTNQSTGSALPPGDF